MQIFVRGLLVAGIVGPVLTLINQFDAITSDVPLNLIQFALTMTVPFLVSTTSGFFANRAAKRETGQLVCEYEDRIAELSEQLSDSDPEHVRGNDAVALTSADQDNWPPDKHHNWEMAVTKIKQIEENARNVNEASRERVQFIEDLIDRTRNLQAELAQLGGRAEDTRAGVSNLDTHIDRISDGILRLNADVTSANSPLQHLRDTADQFGKQFKQVRVSTERLGSLSTQIRLLALNASVEAARHGRDGEGFKVVAQEVRLLAETSASDINHIAEATTALDQLFSALNDLILSLSESIEKCDSVATSCREVVVDACRDIKSISAEVITFSQDTGAQIPTVNALTEDIDNIRKNTEAAVVGSAKNIALCQQANAALQ